MSRALEEIRNADSRPGGDESPLERLWRRGLRALSDVELLALLLRTGPAGFDPLEIAREVLRDEGLAGVARLDESLLYRSRWGEDHAATLLAAVELAQRLASLRMPARRLLDRTDRVAAYLILSYQGDQEVMGALYLDVRNRLIVEREIFRGTQGRAVVSPREILKYALAYGAASFVLFHTHPSGDPAPSVEDLSFTRRLHDVAEALGVPLRDHLILGSGGRWVSVKRRGGI